MGFGCSGFKEFPQPGLGHAHARQRRAAPRAWKTVAGGQPVRLKAAGATPGKGNSEWITRPGRCAQKTARRKNPRLCALARAHGLLRGSLSGGGVRPWRTCPRLPSFGPSGPTMKTIVFPRLGCGESRDRFHPISRRLLYCLAIRVATRRLPVPKLSLRSPNPCNNPCPTSDRSVATAAGPPSLGART